MSIQVTVKTPGTELAELPEGAMRYLVAREGVYLQRRTSMYQSCVQVEKGIPVLLPHEQSCQLNCPRLPMSMLSEMIGFFKAGYDQHGGEAALILLLNPSTGEYRWHCPRQWVEMYWSWGRYRVADSVEFDPPLELSEGFIHFGDAHSHHGAAVPSFIDRHDEKYQDGLHIIVGNIAAKRQTWHADFCIDGVRFTVPEGQLIDGLPEPPLAEPPAEWMQQIEVVYEQPYHKKWSYDTSSNWSDGDSKA